MDSVVIKVLSAAGAASAAAVSACVINKFRNIPAGSCALLGAALPWLLYAIFSHWATSGLVALVGFALFVSSFLFALIFYSLEDPSPTRSITLGIISISILASLFLTAFIAYGSLLSGS